MVKQPLTNHATPRQHVRQGGGGLNRDRGLAPTTGFSGKKCIAPMGARVLPAHRGRQCVCSYITNNHSIRGHFLNKIKKLQSFYSSA